MVTRRPVAGAYLPARAEGLAKWSGLTARGAPSNLPTERPPMWLPTLPNPPTWLPPKLAKWLPSNPPTGLLRNLPTLLVPNPATGPPPNPPTGLPPNPPPGRNHFQSPLPYDRQTRRGPRLLRPAPPRRSPPLQTRRPQGQGLRSCATSCSRFAVRVGLDAAGAVAARAAASNSRSCCEWSWKSPFCRSDDTAARRR